MTEADFTYLLLSLGGVILFALALAYASAVAGDRKTIEQDR